MSGRRSARGNGVGFLPLSLLLLAAPFSFEFSFFTLDGTMSATWIARSLPLEGRSHLF
jgi:hypothetical protein